MRAYLEGDAETGELVLEFEGAERELLLLALAALKDDYEADYDSLPDVQRRYWDGTLTVSQGPDLAEAAADLKDARLGWRSDRLRALERWLGPESGLAGNDDLFVLPADDIEQFLSVLNDRRLLLAAVHAVNDGKMEENPADVEDKDLQRALWEIHFLAFVMENCLQALRDDSA